MKAFHFKKFSLKQNENVFRVGTDGVLLGALADLKNATQILEVGTGSGLISLMLAQRADRAFIHAIDINPDAVTLAESNFKQSPFAERLTSSLCDFKIYRPDKKFDLIISNPPYFEANDSAKDRKARQQIELSFSELIHNAARLLTENGRLSVIIPYSAGVLFEEESNKANLHLVRKIVIYGMVNATPKRLILEFEKEKREVEHLDFVIEQSPRIYSEQYLKVTGDFHQFKNNK